MRTLTTLEFRKLDAIEKFSKKLDKALKEMYNIEISTEDKFWSLKREVKIRTLLKKTYSDYEVILGR